MLLYVTIYRSYKLLKQSGFLAQPVLIYKLLVKGVYINDWFSYNKCWAVYVTFLLSLIGCNEQDDQKSSHLQHV